MRRIFSTSAANVVISIFIVGIIQHSTPAQSRGAVSQAWQLTHSQTYDPSFSPDGTKIVYIIVLAGKEQLFISNADGSGVVQVTHDDADHEDPAWSPDGKTIVFVYMKNGSETISVMNLDGSDVRKLTPPNIKAIHPDWSPDGRTLAYCTDDDLAPPRKNDSEIQVIDMASGRISTLISGGVNTYPVYSPDGKRMLFRRMLGEMNSEVFVADADGSKIRNLTNHPAFDGWPAWSPDGTQIAFCSNRNSNYQVFLMNADGSNVRLLANTEGRATNPKWTPDGQHVYFSNCRKVDFGSDCEIFVAKTNGFTR